MVLKRFLLVIGIPFLIYSQALFTAPPLVEINSFNVSTSEDRIEDFSEETNGNIGNPPTTLSDNESDESNVSPFSILPSSYVTEEANIAATGGTWFAYVANYAASADGADLVTPINTSNNTPGNPISVGLLPGAIAITPNAMTAYVVNTGNGSVTPINLATNTPGTSIPVGSEPLSIAITPNGVTAYVPNFDDNTITPINVATNTAGPAFSAGLSGPSAIAITPNGMFAYVVNSNVDTVTVINLATQTPIATIPVGLNPVAIAITPNGATAYVANFFSNNVTPINLATNTAGTPITVGASPNGIAINSIGTLALVTNNGNSDVSLINIPSNTIEATIPVGAFPIGVAITPDGKTAYVANSGDSDVTPINLLTDTPGPVIPIENGPNSIAITPDQSPISSFAVTPGAAGMPTFFDGSASTTPVGTIVSYAWNFGDGTTAVTTGPTTTHTYTIGGPFLVTLTVTNSAGTSTFQTFTGQTVSNNGGPLAESSQLISLTPQPPSNFIGTVRKNKFLNKTEHILRATWTASSSLDIVFYRIYKDGKIVDEIPATSHLVFITSVDSVKEAKEYAIAAVNSGNIESARIPIVIVHKSK